MKCKKEEVLEDKKLTVSFPCFTPRGGLVGGGEDMANLLSSVLTKLYVLIEKNEKIQYLAKNN